MGYKNYHRNEHFYKDDMLKDYRRPSGPPRFFHFSLRGRQKFQQAQQELLTRQRRIYSGANPYLCPAVKSGGKNQSGQAYTQPASLISPAIWQIFKNAHAGA